MSTRNSRSFRPGVVELESREVPAVLGTPTLANGIVTVHCDTSPSTVIVTQTPNIVQIQDVVLNKVWNFATSQVKRVDVFGGGGTDTFTGRGNVGVGLRMYAGSGDTTMYGAQGRTIMVGGTGDDHLYGRSGNDYLNGGAGDDFIYVSRGKNILTGGDGDNTIIGGTGTDAITGGNGDNTIVVLSSVTDKIDPGSGANTLWLGLHGGKTSEIIGNNSQNVIHSVSAFANGASLILNGGKIPEPTTLGNTQYIPFTNDPLFSSDGPTIDDIVERTDSTGKPVLDDGWLLAGLGAIVNADPSTIQQNVVDFGDGTYGVALNGLFFRVDNQLPTPTFGGPVAPAYAQLGVDNSLWVPIVEKAFADYQAGTNSYGSLNGTGGTSPRGTPGDVFKAFGFTPTSLSLSSFSTGAQFGNTVKLAVDSGFPATLSVLTPSATATLIANQVYTITDYSTNSSGTVTQVILRNPMGIDGGGSMDNDPQDGILTININDLFGTTGSLDFGKT